MRLFGFNITRQPVKKSSGVDLITQWPDARSGGGWWPVIRESFAGAWQRGVTVAVDDSLTHPTYFACLTLIAGDVAKCRPMLIDEDDDGTCEEVTNPAYSPVLRKPNHYQNRIQFYAQWVISKCSRGNTYVLKERDQRGVVNALYILDPTRVRPLVSPAGDVYYALQQDALAGVTAASVVVPATEIIHDRMNTLYHPLIGLSPVYAAGHAAIQALTIMRNATRIFQAGSQVGGILTAPGEISAESAAVMQKNWENNFAGPENIGRVAVLGGGLKFEKPDVMSAVDAQLIDQLKWDDEKICAVLHVPAYMVAVGPLPSYNNVEALGQQYYGQCLQVLFESIELCLTEGLEIKAPQEVEFDVEALDRMDSVQRIDVATKAVAGGVLSPNEARLKYSRRLEAVPGGDRVYLQKQCWPLELLGTDQPAPTPPAPPSPSTTEPPAPVDDAIDTEALVGLVAKYLEAAA